MFHLLFAWMICNLSHLLALSFNLKQGLTSCSSTEKTFQATATVVNNSTCGDLPLGQRLEMRGAGGAGMRLQDRRRKYNCE